MEGLSERAYAAHSGLSRGAIQKARKAGRLVVYGDGSINAAASDARRAEMTDPDQQRRSTGGETGIQRPGRQRILSEGPHRTDGLSGPGTPARDPEEEGHAGGSRPGGNAGVSTGAAGARCLGHLAQPRRSADRGGPDSGGGKAIRRDSYDRGRDPAEGAGNPCQSATRRPCRSPGQPRTVTARPMMI